MKKGMRRSNSFSQTNTFMTYYHLFAILKYFFLIYIYIYIYIYIPNSTVVHIITVVSIDVGV